MPLLNCYRATVLPLLLCAALAGCGSQAAVESDAPQPLPVSRAPVAPQAAAPVKLPAIDSLGQIDTVPQIAVRLRPPASGSSIDAVETEMVNISYFYQTFNAPVLELPFCPHSAMSYCRAMMTLEEQRKADLAWLFALDPAAIATTDAGLAQSIGPARDALIQLLDDDARTYIHSLLERSRDSLRVDMRLLMTFLESPIAAPPANPSQWLVRSRVETQLMQMINTALLIDQILNVDSQFPASKLAARELILRHRRVLQQHAAEIPLPAPCPAPGAEAIARDTIGRLNQTAGTCESLTVLTAPATSRCVEYFVTDTGVTVQACQRRMFEVATIENADGRPMLFTHVLARFEHGNHRVTADRWYVAERRPLGFAAPSSPTARYIHTAAQSH